MAQKSMVAAAGVLIAVSAGIGFGVARWVDPGAPPAVSLDDHVSLSEYVRLEARAARLEAELSHARTELAARGDVTSSPPDPVSDAGARAPATKSSEEDTGISVDWVMERLRERDYQAFVGIPSPEEIEATLEKHGRTPEFLVAASLLASGEKAIEYLEEALEKDPEAPAALARAAQVLSSEGLFDESFKDFVDRLKKNDPTNALGTYYEALWYFENGTPDQGIEALKQAGSITHLKDYSVHHLPVLETFYRDAVGSESVAKILTTIGSRLDSLGHLRDIARWSEQEAAAREGAGRIEEAIAIQRYSAELGNKLSAASRFLVQELVGTSVERKALTSMKDLLERLGRREAVADINLRLQSIVHRADESAQVASDVERALQELGEAELVEFFERMALEGETAAARRLRKR